jgi:hypothetical protein
MQDSKDPLYKTSLTGAAVVGWFRKFFNLIKTPTQKKY